MHIAGGNIARGLWRLSSVTRLLEPGFSLEVEQFLHSHLNSFLRDPGQFGYKILHNETLILPHNHSSLPNIYPW